MTMTPIAVLEQAADYGLKLEAHGNDLHVLPSDRVPADFVVLLKEHKPQLLTLLRQPSCMVYAELLSETIFFAQDENTKAVLVEAGAESFSIYTKDELRILVAHNRATPFLPDQLQKLHEAKRGFDGTVTL